MDKVFHVGFFIYRFVTILWKSELLPTFDSDKTKAVFFDNGEMVI